jgi:peptidoglycan/LPS O-acetylase OafA/YrhL
MTSNSSGSERLHSLDALRGVAALAVVFWHWQHFGLIGSVTQAFEREQQPLYGLFRLFYDHGLLAVDLFFSLSGFIFFWLYSQRISTHGITPAQFFILRFSRLFPLHIATLLFVAIGQAIHIASHGHGYVYANTDVRHFVLNLFLISSVGLEKGASFNAPIWSVSVEGLLYLIFFAFCRLRLNRPRILLVASVIGFTVLHQVYSPVGRGVGSFFLGGFTYFVYTHVRSRADSRSVSVIVIGMTILLWVTTLSFMYLGSASDQHSLLWQLSGALPPDRFAEIALFPMSILSLALFEARIALKVPALELLGSISYSSYLLHFPLQLVIALTLPAAGVGTEFFQSAASLILFFLLLISMSLASYRYLEMPAQLWIRTRWLARRSVPLVVAGR